MSDDPTGPTTLGGDGLALCPPVLEPLRCHECGRNVSAHPHSPMGLTSSCYDHVPEAPGDLRCPATCFSEN